MPELELAIVKLEQAHQNLVAENPADFSGAERATRERGLAIEAVLALLAVSIPSASQLTRLKRIHLGGILGLERIRFARQNLREELAGLSHQGRVLSGYRSGSKAPL